MSKLRYSHSVSALQVLFAGSFLASCAAISDIPLHAGDSKKIDQVLSAEAAGKPINRRESLADQIDDEMAQWQSGRILIDGEWVELEAMTEHKLAPQLEQYQKRRDAQELDIEGHRQLALWCQSHQMPEMAEIHWKAVAAVAVDDEQAHKALGHKNIDGKWFSSEELAAAADEKEQLKAGLKKWLPQLRKIANNLNSSEGKNKLEALRQLESINSRDAVGALKFAALSVEPSVAMPLVSKIKAIKSKESCLALCEIALVNPNSEVGRLAVSGLTGYDQHFYVPELLQLLETPVSVSQQSFYMPNGSLVVRYAYAKETMSEKNLAEVIKIVSIAHAENTIFVDQLDMPSKALDEFRKLFPRGTRIEAANEQARSSTERLSNINGKLEEQKSDLLNQIRQASQANAKNILSRVSGLPATASADQFWDWWPTINEQGTGSKGSVASYYVDDSNPVLLSVGTTLRFHSCLIAGTPVQSSSGLKPVEQFKVGDVVPSLNVNSGEVSLRPVTHVSVRTADATYLINTKDGEVIRATGGHNWWVSGHGWSKSRELKAGQYIRTSDASVEIVKVEKIDEPVKVHNLIVDENHTYFVGNNRLLSWDVTSLQPTLQTVPGRSYGLPY